MVGTHRALRTLACLLLAGALSATATAASASSPPALHGVTVPNLTYASTPAQIDSELNDAQRLGANMIRVDTNWASLQPVDGAHMDSGYLGLLDHIVQASASRGIKPLLEVLRSPCWASSGPGAPGVCTNFIAYGPRDPATYGAVLATLAHRYNRRLAGFEIWNEPDHEGQFYFAGPNKPQRYAALLKAAYRAIKGVNGSIPVVGGALVGVDKGFLQALYANGIKGFYDALSFHPYNSTLSAVRDIRAAQRAAHDSKPIWLAEFGWSSCFPGALIQGGGHACVTPAIQAQNLGDLFRAIAGHPFIQAAAVYDLYDKPDENFGLIDVSGADKPAFAIVHQAFSGGLGPPRGVVLRLVGHNATGSIPAGDYGKLRALYRGGEVWAAAFLPDRNNQFNIPLPASLFNKPHRLVLTQFWTGRQASVNLP